MGHLRHVPVELCQSKAGGRRLGTVCAMGFCCAQSPGEIGVASAQSMRSVPSHISTWPGDVYGDSAVGQLPGWAAAPLLDPSHLHLHVPPFQIRATMVAPAPMALAPSSASAWLVSVGPSARRTSMSVPATPARTGPTALTASTATPAPAPPASAASTARTTPLTAQRGTVLELGHRAEVPVLPHSPGLVCGAQPAVAHWSVVSVSPAPASTVAHAWMASTPSPVSACPASRAATASTTSTSVTPSRA